MNYVAIVLDDPSRATLLEMFPPIHPDVYAHHVTIQFGVNADVAEALMACYPGIQTITVHGYAYADDIEALVVSVNGNSRRLDGKHYHITLSLDKAKGKRPVHSNNIINEFGWIQTHSIQLTGTVAYL